MTGAAPTGRFPPAQRVRKRPEFQRIQALGRRLNTPRFVLLVAAREDEQGARLGVTASRKIGGSVTRTRAKRLVREAFRATRELWAADVDLVVIVRRSLEGLALADVVGEWQSFASELRRRTREARRDRERRAAALAQPGETPQTRPGAR
ncbi:MAG: ribonuclease P protein component [Sorangiineae bacterium]|nr:ribonuclease P protein component [Polyangiaceae bacterium]MEB2322036.1 ribonuclease P protein component [Sorangiineae bacterium]